MHEEKCLERYIGQIVWNLDIPVIGPDRDKVKGIHRGEIVAIEGQGHRTTYHVKHDSTGEIDRGFDYRYVSKKDLEILVAGGLLDRQHPDGFFNHNEDPIDEIPLYRKVLENPEASYIAA